MKTKYQLRKELDIKEKRVSFWETHSTLPAERCHSSLQAFISAPTTTAQL